MKETKAMVPASENSFPTSPAGKEADSEAAQGRA